MKFIKYISLLFISMYVSLCIYPAAAEVIDCNNRTTFVYVLLVPAVYFILLLCGYILSAIFGSAGEKKIAVISERQPRKEKYVFGLDLIRFFAVISVPAIHFFGLTGFYNTPLDSRRMFFAVCIRWLFICCVPLFLMLTGYLKHNKGVSAKHYIDILLVLATHIFITSIRIFVDYKYHGIDVDVSYIIDKLVYFEYGWYVRLYIVIMLVIPFVNNIWNGLKEKSHKELLIVTLIFICSMNPFMFYIVPAAWAVLYVFIYYFMGAYISEYKIKINRGLNVLFIAAMLLLSTIGIYLNKANGNVFNWSFAAYSSDSGYSSLPVIIITFLIFILLVDIDTKYTALKQILRSFSIVSLEMYMFSQMFDEIIYPKLGISHFRYILPYMPLVVGVIVFMSYIVSWFKKFIFFCIKKFFGIFIKN